MTKTRDRKRPAQDKPLPPPKVIVDYKREFLKTFEGMDRRKHRYDVFRDFLTLAFTAIAQGPLRILGDTKKADALEAEYMKVVETYKPDDLDVIREKMPKLLALTLQGVHERCDFLGEVYHALELHNKELGQFFTPYSLCLMMAKMNISNLVPIIEEKRFVTAQEPACGAGAMLLALGDAIQDEGKDPALSLWFEAIDLSEFAFKMCYIQCALRGLAGRVTHGNSLTMEMYNSYLTPAAIEFIAFRGNPFKEQDGRTDLGPPLVNTKTNLKSGDLLA